ncbi:MAG: hypothetical protein WKG01_02630 [Kofleriaceae bacterium]
MKSLAVVAVLGLLSLTSEAKPTAPVEVRLTAKPVAGGYQVTLVATPRHAVPALELVVAGKRLAFAATRAGQTRSLVVTVPVAARRGVDVVGTAIVDRRSRATVLRLGEPAREKLAPATIRTLPDGRKIAEVR